MNASPPPMHLTMHMVDTVSVRARTQQYHPTHLVAPRVRNGGSTTCLHSQVFEWSFEEHMNGKFPCRIPDGTGKTYGRGLQPDADRSAAAVPSALIHLPPTQGQPCLEPCMGARSTISCLITLPACPLWQKSATNVRGDAMSLGKIRC
jgi:hypothetical protein